MQKVRIPINSFQFGEVSDSLILRTDTTIYQSSAQRVENFIIRAEGGALKRGGLKNIYDYGIGRDTTKTLQSRLTHFYFSEDERYIISIEHGQIRCFFLENNSNDITLVDTVTQDTDSNPLPFDHQYMNEYHHTQYGDVLFVTHPLFMPRMIIRTSLTSFEVTPFSFDQRADNKVTYQPYSEFHPVDYTLDPSASTGNGITLTISGNYFDISGSIVGGNYPDSKHVGVTLRYDTSEIVITSVQSATQATGDVVDNLKTRLATLNPIRTIDGSSTIEVTHINHGFASGEVITIEEASAVGGINAGSINGSRTVSGIIDENTYNVTVGGSSNLSEDGGGYVKIVTHAPTRKWNEQSFSAVRGYPAAVVFHENRLVYGGTISEPDAIWFSGSGKFFNFNVGTAQDNEAINLVAATGEVNSIRYMVSNRDLQIFTASSELYVPTYLNQAITPTNAQIRKQTPYGSNFVEPSPFDGATLFIQANGSVVREYLYTDTEQAYTSTAVSTTAAHLLNAPKCLGVINGAFGKAESYAVFVNQNGECGVFSSNRAEKRAGWTRFTTQGSFDFVISIDDRLFANVWFDETTLRLCEFDLSYQLDNSKLYAFSTGVANVSSDFTDGREVHVIGINGAVEDYLGAHTVASGNVTVSGASGNYTHAYIGYMFTTKIVTNPIDGQIAGGVATGIVRGITGAVVDFTQTKSASVNNRKLITDSVFDGKKEFRLRGYSRDPQITITQDEPLSIQVNGLIAELII